MNFNQSQTSAIRHKDGPMLVLAGPGSGKTAVITQRTYNLIHEHKINPGNILVITFTKAAASEMKQRFLRMANAGESRVTFGTFHAVFFMILKHAYHFESSNVISEEKKYALMKELISSYHLEYRDENEFIGNLLGEISKIKNEHIDLAHFYSAHCGEEVFRKIYEAYTGYLKGNRLIDFDDMLLYTYELFSQRKDILAMWQKKYSYIMIDEFQDINRIQYEIIRLMAAPNNNLFVVGDDDQSIYGFRGSRPEFIMDFDKDYPGTKRVLLDVNYRSLPPIVKEASQLIGHNQKRYPKDIKAHRQGDHTIRYLSFENPREEAKFIVAELQERMQKQGDLQECAVLYRINSQPRILAELMMECAIPFSMRDCMPNIYEHWIARDLFTYLEIAKGSRKRSDFLQIMNRPKRYIGRDSLKENEVDFNQWIRHYERASQPWIAERIEDLRRELLTMSSMSPYAAINYLRKGIGYDEFLVEYAEYRGLKLEELTEILEDLHESARGYKSYEKWREHIHSYGQQMRLVASRRAEEGQGVTLATLHSSKGLEFEQVYIIDVNEGIVPYKKAVLDDEIEEERRLFYVGMTRAKDNLTLCSVKSVYDQKTEPSHFLEEARG